MRKHVRDLPLTPDARDILAERPGLCRALQAGSLRA